MDSSKTKSSTRSIGVAATNLMLGALFFTFAYANALSFIEHPRLSVLLILITETILAVFVLIRHDPDQTRHTWRTWTTTTFGTFLPLLLRATDASTDLLIGQIIQTIGFVMQIIAILSLNRSFGLLPAHRGVKSDGLYRIVRHPLYAAYTFAFCGFLINNPSVANFAIVISVTVFQVLRIREEEGLLLTYPDYAAFAQKVRWRLIPAIW
jgi:protein-S-isoprenylcysteine O-methyltransferase Ste14